MNLLQKLEKVNIISWILQHNIKTERGTPFDFQKFSFMIDPWLDWYPLQASRKCTQIGWSVMTNLKLMFAAKHGIPGYGIPAANVIYTLPSDKDVSDFVPSKTNLLIANNPVIAGYMKDESGNKRDNSSVQRKQFGESSMVYFKGTRSKTAALMLTSDLNIHDESDRSESSIIEQYESRLDQSLYKGRWIFSNPSAPNMPADLFFQQSDQKHWFIKCEHCGHWQYLDWKRLSEHTFVKALHCYVDDTNMCYVCGSCAMPITDANRQRGRWVKKVDTAKVSGYWVSHMMCSWKSVQTIHELERGKNGDGVGAKSKAYMHNFVFGLPYVGSDVLVDESVIVNNLVLDQIQWKRGAVAMGIDNGDTKWYVIGDERGIWEYGSTRSWDDIERLIQKYDPYYVVDLNPLPNKPRELTKKYRKGRASFYVDDRKTTELIEWGAVGSDKGNMVYPNRERIIDSLVSYIFEGNLKFFGAKAKWEQYISHWITLYQGDMIGDKIVMGDSVANEQGLKPMRKVWLSSTGLDHLVHATVYFYVALQRLKTGHAQVMQGSTQQRLAGVARELGGVKPAPVVVNNQIKPLRPLKQLVPSFQKKRGNTNGAVSGNM